MNEENLLSTKISITNTPIDINAVRRLPMDSAKKYCVIPIAIHEESIEVLIEDTFDYFAIEEIRFLTGLKVTPHEGKKEEILRSIHEFYSEIETQKAANSANEDAGILDHDSFIAVLEGAEDTSTGTLINSIIYKAYSTGASDVHIEPFADIIKLRIRVDGQIVYYLSLRRSLHNPIVARIKILSNLDIAEKRIPQDGHFRAKLNDIDLNVRVSTMPTVYGEKVVLRFMSQNIKLDNEETFGMSHFDYEKMTELLRIPHGLIYMTGPTGSGKTTTLYLMIEYLSKQLINIATVEDPVEKNIPNINQTQINPLAGLTFESGLRALLRQDPDILMIGETRDRETASICVRAALTGHLVLSTLHTSDSISAIVRLLDMGVEHYLLSSSLTGIVAQRLVKKICPYCKEKIIHDPIIQLRGQKFKESFQGIGCHNCNFTGYKGRIAIHEIFVVDAIVRKLISDNAPIESIYAHAHSNEQFVPLQEKAIQLVKAEITTVKEILKVINFDQ